MQRTTTRTREKGKKELAFITLELEITVYFWQEPGWCKNPFGDTAEIPLWSPQQSCSWYRKSEEKVWIWGPDTHFLKEEGSRGVASLPLAQPAASCTLWITWMACSCSVPSRSTAELGLVRHQTDRRKWHLLSEKEAWESTRQREYTRKLVVKSKRETKYWSVLVLCSCLCRCLGTG